MNNKYNEVPEDKKVSLGLFEANVVNPVNRYVSLLGIKRTDFIKDLILKELEGKVLTNDFIELDRPFYFNYTELVDNGTVKASDVKPISNLEDVVIIKKVPNNLDVFRPELKTYCYNLNPNLHKGIYIYHKLFWNAYLIDSIVNDFIIFQYDLEANEIELGLINDVSSLDLYVEDNSEENKELFKRLLEEAEEFNKDINKNVNPYTKEIEYSANIDLVFKSFEVIEPYKQKRRLINSIDLSEEIEVYLKKNPELVPEESSDLDLIAVFKKLMKDKKINEDIIEELIDNSNFIKRQLEQVDHIMIRLQELEAKTDKEILEEHQH